MFPGQKIGIMKKEIVDAVLKLVEENPDIGAFVLDSSKLLYNAPYTVAISAVVSASSRG